MTPLVPGPVDPTVLPRNLQFVALASIDTQVDFAMSGLLNSDETVLRQGKGANGLVPSAVVLTNRRLIFFRVRVFSNLRIVGEVRLEDVLAVEVASGDLRVEARSGMFVIAGGGKFQREIREWPSLILDAQDALKRGVSPVLRINAEPTGGVSYSTNGFAIVSLITAIVGFGGVLAVIFGHIAHSQIRRTGERGWGMATAGLIIGYIGIVVGVALAIVYFYEVSRI